jgi:TetR/AcrR family transcriptional regulator
MFIGIELIQTGINESEIRPDVDPVEAIILLSVIINGMVNMGSWSKEILESKGIDEKKFTDATADFYLNMLSENVK